MKRDILMLLSLCLIPFVWLVFNALFIRTTMLWIYIDAQLHYESGESYGLFDQ